MVSMSDILSANIRRLDVGALIALSKLLAQRNVSRVAREVGLSQPAMSHLLARLRTAFGDELLVRDGTGLVLTAAGAQLQARLEAALPHLLGVFAGETFDPASSFVHFKLGITDHAGQVLLPGLLAELHERAPRATVSVAVIPNRQTDLSALDEGRYDLRFGWLRSLPPQWHRRKLLDDRIVLIASADHPGLSEPMTIEDFAALDHVALESERPIYPNLVDRYLASCGLGGWWCASRISPLRPASWLARGWWQCSPNASPAPSAPASGSLSRRWIFPIPICRWPGIRGCMHPWRASGCASWWSTSVSGFGLQARLLPAERGPTSIERRGRDF